MLINLAEILNKYCVIPKISCASFATFGFSTQPYISIISYFRSILMNVCTYKAHTKRGNATLMSSTHTIVIFKRADTRLAIIYVSECPCTHMFGWHFVRFASIPSTAMHSCVYYIHTHNILQNTHIHTSKSPTMNTTKK